MRRNSAPFSHQSQSTNRLFSLAAAVIKTSYDFPAQNGNYFVSDDYANLASSSLAVFVKRVPPIHHYLCKEATILGLCSCTKTHVIALSEACTQTQFINRCEGKHFFSLQKDVTFGVCGVRVTKVSGSGHSACRRISSDCRRKKRETQLVVQKHFHS